MSNYTGSCLCGGVTFEIDGDIREISGGGFWKGER
jgi:hypothetical protein